jgi:hypothetical protein
MSLQVLYCESCGSAWVAGGGGGRVIYDRVTPIRIITNGLVDQVALSHSSEPQTGIHYAKVPRHAGV